MHRHPGRVGHRNRPDAFQGRHSRRYDFVARRLLRGGYRRFAEDLAAAAPDGGAVLDVGTGPGVLLVELARLRPDLRLTGVDLSPDMAAAATRNLAEFGERASVHTGNVTDLRFPDESFDLVASSFSLHHWDDPRAAAPELVRVLRPGGRLYIFDFRAAPFDELDTGLRATARSPGPPQRTLIRAGIPLFPRIVRYVLPIETP